MTTRLKHNRSRRGTALVEVAMVMPVLVGLFLGMCELGPAINSTIVLQHAAAYGGRLASIGESTNAQVKAAVLGALTVSGISTTHAVVTVANLTHSGTDVKAASTLDKLQVTVTVPFKDVKWGVSGFVINDSKTITATAYYSSARVNPYPTNISAPAGS
ncbi:MAG TPA: TadE/TadG family type IV pilus assembly protein [Lacipirellulaceae bacterium]|nr:TadE/TadG family type IV pilus assembly protein [Lacipirellulaceae bacterium]